MDGKKPILDRSKLSKILGVVLSVVLIVFELIICIEYSIRTPRPEVWKIITLVASSVILDALFFIELYAVKTFKARIAIYSIDFVFLLIICALTGNAYLSGLYCIFLTQLYINVDEMRTKAIVFGASCLMFVVTIIIGWAINYRRAITPDEILNIASGELVGLIVLSAHFLVANFLLGFYRNNLKLTAALKEADESKKQLEEAYEELSETAVFQERNRIARDIHDNAGHSMTAVIMQTEAAKLLIDSDPKEAKRKIISANVQAKNALEQMRDSVHLLAGRESSRSLKEELEEILAQTMESTDLKIRYDIADVSLSWARRRFICNSLKECLSNGMRHGGATAFYVELSCTDEEVCLTVSDNGEGLPPDFKEGFGLKGIREKATSFGGSIMFASESGDGCEIKIVILAKDKEG